MIELNQKAIAEQNKKDEEAAAVAEAKVAQEAAIQKAQEEERAAALEAEEEAAKKKLDEQLAALALEEAANAPKPGKAGAVCAKPTPDDPRPPCDLGLCCGAALKEKAGEYSSVIIEICLKDAATVFYYQPPRGETSLITPEKELWSFTCIDSAIRLPFKILLFFLLTLYTFI